jgi:hypothetical protein
MKRLLFAAVFVSISSALSGTLPPDGYSRLSDSDILQAWSLANEACRHTPAACEQRDAIDREMPARGYCYVGDGNDAHWSRCGASAPAPSPFQPPQASTRPAPIPQPPPTGDASRDSCPPGSPPSMGGCYENDAPALYGRPGFEALPDEPYPMVEEGNWADIHAQCVRLRHAIFSTAIEAARARAACRGR